MNAPQQMGIEGDAETRMQEALQAQRDSYLQEGAVSAETRIDRIDRAIDVLVRYGEKVSDALNSDFTCRPREVNLLTDVIGSVGSMKHAKKHVRKWMKPEKRPTSRSTCWAAAHASSTSPRAWLVWSHPGTSRCRWYFSRWPVSWLRVTG